MADTILTDLGAVTVASGDILYIIDISDTTDNAAGSSKRITVGSLLTGYVTLTGTETLTNKTLTSPVLTTPQINDTTADHQYIVAVSELTADRTVTFPLLTGNDTFVFASFTQTLTNKTIDGDDNTVQDLPYSAIKSTSRTGSDAKLVTGTAGTSADLVVWNADGDIVDGPTPPSGTIVGTTDTQTLTNKRINKRVVSTTDDASSVIDCDVTDIYELTAIANATTFTVTGTPVNGQTLIIRGVDAGVGKGLTFTGFTAVGVTIPTTTVADKKFYVGCVYNTVGTDTWDVIAVVQEA
jgi:hypothetical protein